jgi:hypothetical protein
MSRPVNPLVAMAGLLLILFGICLTLAGGSCVVLMLGSLGGGGAGLGSGGGQILVIALVILGLGLLSIAAGWKCLQPPRDG